MPKKAPIAMPPPLIAPGGIGVGGVLRGAAPWIAFYATLFFAARALGPRLFSTCAKMTPADQSYWAASVASVVNCLVLVPMAAAASVGLPLLSRDAPFTINSPLSTSCCCAMVGYTVYDLAPLLYHRAEWGGVGMYLVHHVCTVLSWGITAASGYSHALSVPVLFLETTGPFVNARWFLSQHGYKDTKLYVANGIAMFLAFFALRVVFNWGLAIARFWLQYDAFFGTQPTYVIASILLFYPINLVLQLMWFQKILKGILALLLSGGGSKKKKAT